MSQPRSPRLSESDSYKWPSPAVEAVCKLMESDDRGTCDFYSARGWLNVVNDMRRILARMDDEGQAEFTAWLTDRSNS